MKVSVEDARPEPIYALVPIIPLPTIDLSKSIGTELLPKHVDAFILYCLERFIKPLQLASVLSLCLNVAVIVLNQSIGQCLSLASTTLGLPIIIGSVCTLRYDIVRLALHTFEFWSFFIILTATTSMYTAFVGDLRIPRVFLDWIGCLSAICLDGQIHDLRHHVIGVLVAIAPVSMMLIWSMLGRIYGGKSFTILQCKNQNDSFELDTLDIMGNGFVTLILLFIKIGYRKRVALQLDDNASRVDCAILRTGLKLEIVEATTSQSRRLSSSNTFERRTQSHAKICAAPAPASEVFIQQMQQIQIKQRFTANSVIFPIQSATSLRVPALGVFFLYLFGVVGLTLACVIPVLEWSPQSSNTASSLQTSVWAWVSLLCTIAFNLPCWALYHRKLLRILIFDFDFAFYSFQITSANICIAMLYRWNASHVVLMVVWWIWAHWALTLDALTPIIRTKLRLRIQYGAPVIALFLCLHLAITCSIFFIKSVSVHDVVIWTGTIWRHQVRVCVLPYYFSRVATLSLWCCRLIWRLVRTSEDGVTLIRAGVSYENCFICTGPSHSLTTSSSSLIVGASRIMPAVPDG